MSDITPASGKCAESGIPVVAVVARIAATCPARVAAEFGDDFVTYGRLNTVIESYRAVMDEQDVDQNAAVFAAVLNTLPGLADETPGRVTDQIVSILRHITVDAAASIDATEGRHIG